MYDGNKNKKLRMGGWGGGGVGRDGEDDSERGNWSGW